MGGHAAMAGKATLPAFCATYRKLVNSEDGAGVVRQFEEVAEYQAWHRQGPRLDSVPQDHIQGTAANHGGEPYGEVLSLYLLCIRARALGQSVQELELACTCLKTWVQRYIEA